MAIQPLTQAQLIELWRKLFPEGYTVPIEEESGGLGMDVFAQQAAQFARVAEAINRTTQSYYIRAHSQQTAPPATGPLYATGTVDILRETQPGLGPVTVPQGTVLASRKRNANGEYVEGPRFALAAAQTFSPGPMAPAAPLTAPVTALRVGTSGNLTPGHIYAFAPVGRLTVLGCAVTAANTIQQATLLSNSDQFNTGMLGRYVRFLTGPNATTYPRKIVSIGATNPLTLTVDGPALVADPSCSVEAVEWEDLGFVVTQPAATTGGEFGELDQIGSERNVFRVAGESDATYAKRIQALPDTVSPAAMERICNRILAPYGINYRIKETRDPAGLFGFIFDLDNASDQRFRSALDYGDIGNGSVLLGDPCGAVRFFVICVGPSGLGEFGAPYDATVNLPNPNAWDELFFDGYALGYAGVLLQLYAAIEAAKAAGVCWRLIFDPNL